MMHLARVNYAHCGALLVDAAEAINGEGPQWDEERKRLYWVDMRRPSLRAFEPATCRKLSWEMPAWIGCFGLPRDGRMVVALRTGIALFDPEDGSLQALVGAPYDQRRFCFNDGGCDRAGHFLVGPMYHPLAPATAIATRRRKRRSGAFTKAAGTTTALAPSR